MEHRLDNCLLANLERIANDGAVRQTTDTDTWTN